MIDHDQQLKQMNQLEFENFIAFAALSIEQQSLVVNSQRIATLKEFRQNNPSKFYILCSELLANESKSFSIRKYCGELIENSMQQKKKMNNHYWKEYSFTQENWLVFQHHIIQVLSVENDVLRNLGIKALLQLGYCQFLKGLAFDFLLQFAQNVNSQNQLLKQSTIQLLIKWCEKLLQNLFNIDKETCIKKLQVIAYMAINFQFKDNPLTSDFNILLLPLANVFKDNFINIVQQLPQLLISFSQSIMHLIENYPNEVLIMYFESLAAQIQTNINKIPFNNYVQGFQIYLEMFNYLLTVLLMSRKVETNSTMLCDSVCLIINVSALKIGITCNLIGLISTVANGFNYNQKFEQKLQKQYWNIVFLALNNKQNNLLFLQALRCTGDIARNYPKFFSSKTKQILDQLTYEIKNNQQYENSQNFVKFKEIVFCIFDILLNDNSNVQFEEQCENITMIIDTTSEKVQKWNNDLQVEEMEDIMDVIINFYELFYFRCQRLAPNDKLFGYFHSMWNFVNKTCSLPLKPSLSFMKKCWFATFTGVLYYRKNKAYSDIIMQVLQSKLFQDITNTLTDKNSEYSEEIIKAKKHLFSAVSMQKLAKKSV